MTRLLLARVDPVRPSVRMYVGLLVAAVALVAYCIGGRMNPSFPPRVRVTARTNSSCESLLAGLRADGVSSLGASGEFGKDEFQDYRIVEHPSYPFNIRDPLSTAPVGTPSGTLEDRSALATYFDRNVVRCEGPNKRFVRIAGLASSHAIWDNESKSSRGLFVVPETTFNLYEMCVTASEHAGPTCAVTIEPEPIAAAKVVGANLFGAAHGQSTRHLPFVGFPPAEAMLRACEVLLVRVGTAPALCKVEVQPNPSPLQQ